MNTYIIAIFPTSGFKLAKQEIRSLNTSLSFPT